MYCANVRIAEKPVMGHDIANDSMFDGRYANKIDVFQPSKKMQKFWTVFQ